MSRVSRTDDRQYQIRHWVGQVVGREVRLGQVKDRFQKVVDTRSRVRMLESRKVGVDPAQRGSPRNLETPLGRYTGSLKETLFPQHLEKMKSFFYARS